VLQAQKKIVAALVVQNAPRCAICTTIATLQRSPGPVPQRWESERAALQLRVRASTRYTFGLPQLTFCQ